jgi:glycine/D-amino acid oxidase-like deaminating enzyme
MAGNPQVIVTGAGPVGLLAALALAKQDVAVLVLEAEPGLTVGLRAGTYHPPQEPEAPDREDRGGAAQEFRRAAPGRLDGGGRAEQLPARLQHDRERAAGGRLLP